MHIIPVLLLMAMQQPATPAPAPAASPQPRRVATTTTLEIHVTDRSGATVPGARVTAVGPSLRDGMTNASGVVVFRTVTPGAYRLRADAEERVPLEKDVTLRAGAPLVTELALSAAPPPPAPPPPAPAPPPPAAAPPPPPTGDRGEAHVMSIPDLAERSLKGNDPITITSLGCNGLTSARLIVLRETLPAAAYDDADENLYLVAGEATLSLGAKEQPLTPGWFTMVPRQTKFGIVRKGRNPAILLSLLNGRPCQAKVASSRP